MFDIFSYRFSIYLAGILPFPADILNLQISFARLKPILYETELFLRYPKFRYLKTGFHT